MSDFSMPVHWYMSAPVATVPATLDLNALHHRFIKLNLSSLPAVDDDDNMVGIVSRTDLLNACFDRSAASDAPLLQIPDKTVADIMSHEVLTVDREDTVEAAARLMIENHVHRMVVTKDASLVGVLSSRDVLPAVVDLRLETPAGKFMSTPLFVIAGDEPLLTAMCMLEQAQVSGVVILGDAGPLGVFTQAEAIQCRNLPRNTPVADAMDTGILSIHTSTPMYLAAERTIASQSRRLVVSDEDVRGMITALDFVRATR